MTATAAHAAAVANAIKASGVVVRVEPGEFIAILKRSEAPLVVVSLQGAFRKQHRYLTSYKGLAFYTKTTDALVLPPRTETVVSKSISVPD